MEKERLIRQIQQQRLDLAEHKSLWLEKTERIDRGWQTVFGLRRYLVLGSSVMALYGIRHPSKMIRWSRRAFGAWSAIRLFKRPSPPSKRRAFPSNILLLRPHFPPKTARLIPRAGQPADKRQFISTLKIQIF